MKPETAFDIGLQDYSIHQLQFEDLAAIQALYAGCLDFMLLVDGRPPTPASIEEDFLFVPPGHSPEDKYVFGIVNPQKDLVGLLDVLRSYPEKDTWWIGLLILTPGARSQGVGQKVLEGFSKYARAGGCQAIMLGVVEENMAARRFWDRMGFALVRKTEPQRFANKTHVVCVMRRDLQDI